MKAIYTTDMKPFVKCHFNYIQIHTKVFKTQLFLFLQNFQFTMINDNYLIITSRIMRYIKCIYNITLVNNTYLMYNIFDIMAVHVLDIWKSHIWKISVCINKYANKY